MSVGGSPAAAESGGERRLLLGVLALLADAREARIQGDNAATKTEILLADAGMSNEEIGAVVGKKPDTVRMVVTRARSR